MATGNGNFVSGSGYGWRVQVVVNVASESATQITFNVYGQFYNEHRILSFANGSVSGGGQSRSWNGSTRNLNSGNPGTTNFASYSVTLNKGSSVRNETFSARFQVTGGYGNGTSNASVGVTVPAITYSAPNAPSNCSASRNSDTQATVTWSNGGTSTTQPRTAVLVERQTDSGSWVQVASLSSSATNYTDNAISSNHRYAYRVRSQGNGGTSGYSTSGYIYTTPAAPASVSLTKTTGTKVSLDVDTSNAPYATSWDVQESLNGGEWSDVGSYTTFPQTVDVGGGTAKLRVRSKRDGLMSGWTESATITTIVAPNAPTITAKPASVIAVGSSAVISWTPNHPDGSEQSQAQVEYQVGSASAQTATVQGSVTTYRLPASATASAGTVKVRVRTHGLDPDWGAWTSYYSFAVAVPPEAHFTAPAIDGAKIGDLPLVAEWSITDSTGVASQSLQLMDESGKVLHSATPSKGTRQYTFDASTYQLSNATDYSLRLTVRGGSSLTVTTERTFATSFAEPARPDAGLSVDPSDLSAAVTVYAGSPSSETGEVIEVPATPGTLVPGLTVYGNTRQNLWVNPNTSQNSISATSNADGSVKVSGTPTAQSNLHSANSYVLRPGSTYYLSCSPAPSGFNIGISQYVDGSFKSTKIMPDGGGAVTIDSDVNSVTFVLYGFTAGTSYSCTYRIMLNEGSEPEPWCPPGLNSVDELSIVTAGKNLLARMGPSLPHMTAGITFSDNGDGGIRVSGTATAAACYNFFSDRPARALRITPGEYTASLIGGGSGLNLSVEYYDGEIGGSRTSWLAPNVPGVSNTGSIDRPVYLRPFLSVAKGKTVDTVVYPQLERGSTATAYEPPSVTTTPIDLDGHALHSLPDGTRDELRIDGTGAVTLVQRVGVATAPTAASGYLWSTDIAGGRASFPIPHAPVSISGTQVGHILCDKLPPRTENYDDPSYVFVATNSRSFVRNPVITNTTTAASVAGGMTVLYPLAAPQEVDLPGIVMPAFPAAETQVFCASNVPCEVRVDYPDTDSLSVTRVLADGSRWLVADGLLSGQQTIDPLPPLNADYTYEVTANTGSGAAVTVPVETRIESRGRMALNFGQAAETAHVIGANAKVSYDEGADGELYHFADGGESGGLPQFYGTGDIDASGSVSFELMDRSERDRFKRSARRYAVGWFRDAMGGRIRARMGYSESVSAGGIAVWEESVDMDEVIFEEAW